MASPSTRRPRTTTPPSRTARASRGTASTQGGMRATAQQRATTLARARRKQQPTGIKGLAAKLPDALPISKGSGKRSKSKSSSKNPISGIVSALPIGGAGAKRGKSSSSSAGKRAGGAAILAGAAGLAVKNRDKITSMLGGGRGDGEPAAGATDASTGTGEASVSRLDVTPTDVTTPPQPGATS
jgi:hypothetical protein